MPQSVNCYPMPDTEKTLKQGLCQTVDVMNSGVCERMKGLVVWVVLLVFVGGVLFAAGWVAQYWAEIPDLSELGNKPARR